MSTDTRPADNPPHGHADTMLEFACSDLADAAARWASRLRLVDPDSAAVLARESEYWRDQGVLVRGGAHRTARRRHLHALD